MICTGVALAYDVYRQAFSASSPYIRGTVRDDPRFLWACTSIWFARVVLPRTLLPRFSPYCF